MSLRVDIVNNPLVTIEMSTYNQEKYVRETVQSLLAQTYEPLEIIISDDCSQDRTWEVINEVVEAYKASGGVHKRIVLNRNEKNLGIALHSDLIFRMSHGDLKVSTGGDDVCEPDRVDKIVKAWKADGCKALAIYHDAITIDAEGKEIGSLDESYFGDRTLGAVATYSKELNELFGPIEEPDAAEDEIYGHRAMMLGRRLNIREKLLRYRIGVGVSSGKKNYRKRQIKMIGGFHLASLRQCLKDLEHVKSLMGDDSYHSYKKKLTDKYAYEEKILALLQEESFLKRCKLVGGLGFKHPKSRIVLHLILLLPHKLGDMCLDAIARFKA